MGSHGCSPVATDVTKVIVRTIIVILHHRNCSEGGRKGGRRGRVREGGREGGRRERQVKREGGREGGEGREREGERSRHGKREKGDGLCSSPTLVVSRVWLIGRGHTGWNDGIPGSVMVGSNWHDMGILGGESMIVCSPCTTPIHSPLSL